MNASREAFSKREYEILQLLGQGKSSKEIAVILTVTGATVASHRRSICRKLGVHSTAELIWFAVTRYALRSTAGDTETAPTSLRRE